MPENKGLYEKYNVRRRDGRDEPGGDRADARLFVLDLTHDPYARGAMLQYAEQCERECPQLAEEIRAFYRGEHPWSPDHFPLPKMEGWEPYPMPGIED